MQRRQLTGMENAIRSLISELDLLVAWATIGAVAAKPIEGTSEFPRDYRGKPHWDFVEAGNNRPGIATIGGPFWTHCGHRYLHASPLAAPQSATYMTDACAGKETRYDPPRIRARR